MKNPAPCLILLIVVLSACHQPSKQTTSTSPAPAKNHLRGYPNGGAVIQAYAQYLRTLDTMDLASGQPALSEFDRLFAGQSPEVCDTGFMLFWDFQKSLNLYDSNVRAFVSPVSLDKLIGAEYQDKKLNAREQAAQQKLWSNNFIVKIEEGGSGPFLSPALQSVSRHFSRYVSEPMKEALAQEIIEEKDPYMDDDALIISPGQIVRRAVWWERFMTRYPHHIYDSTARFTYNGMINMMIEGSYNPPPSGDSTILIPPYYDSVYRLLRDSFPDSRTNAVINPWWQAVLAKDSIAMKKIYAKAVVF